MKKWQQKLIPGFEEPGQGETTVTDEEGPAALAQAEEGDWHTKELLATRGWCLWKCSTLGGDIIAVVLDENVAGVPGGYQVYTEGELEELCQGDVSEAHLRLVHEAKKLAGAKVITGVTDNEGGNRWRS